MRVERKTVHQRITVLAVSAALLAIGLLGWWLMRFDTSVEAMLPEQSEARDSIVFLRDSSFAAKAVLWFRFRDGNQEGTVDDLAAAADTVAAKLDPKLVTGVVRPPREADALAQVIGLLDNAGELLGEDDLKEIDRATQPQALKKRMRQAYIQLAKPEGTLMQEIIQRDPLGISSRALTRLYGLTTAIGYRAQIHNAHLVLPEERQLILVLNTAASATDVAGSQALVNHLNEVIATVPKDIQVTPICGHIHTEANNRVMTSDIAFTGIVDGIGFLLVFVIICRDWRVVAVFLVPMLAIAVAAGFCGLVFSTLSALVVGLAATMAGSATDYGIHVYTAVRDGSDPYADARRILRPLLTGMLATAGVFVGFIFSGVPAYRQLGWMASSSLALAVLFAVMLLPAIVKPGGTVMRADGMLLSDWGRRTRPLALGTIVLTLAAIVIARNVRFDGDITRLDGAGPEVAAREAEFQKTWKQSGGEMAMLAVSGKTKDDAARRSDEVYRLVSASLGEGKLVSLNRFWPSEETRKDNLSRWRAFWSLERIAALHGDLAAAAEPYGFASDAFEPFFKSLSNTAPLGEFPEALAGIQQQFWVQTGSTWSTLSYLPDDPETVAAVRKLVLPRGDCRVISRAAIGQAFADSARHESRLMVAISSAFILVSMLVMTGSPKRMAIMMFPAIAGLAMMLAVSVLFGIPLNVTSAIAAIVVLGLCIDYGVFTVHAWEEGTGTIGRGLVSVHLSSLTTLVGTSSLLFAQHPALFLIGVTLTTGLGAGYVVAVVAVPALCHMAMPERKEAPVCEAALP